jgi:hypothetical protein
MDMFMLFVVIFLCVMLGLALSALMLSLLFRVIQKLSPARGPQSLATAAASSPVPRV